MAPHELNLADVDELITALKGGGLNVARKRAAVNLPGIVVQLAGLKPLTFAALEVRLNLLLISPDVDDLKTWALLVDLYNKAVVVLSTLGVQYGDANTDLVTMPGTPNVQLPALVLPVQLLTTQEPS